MGHKSLFGGQSKPQMNPLGKIPAALTALLTLRSTREEAMKKGFS
jgi:hypothetical protein